MDSDKKQKHIQYSIIAFCGTIMICMLLFSFFSGSWGFFHFFSAIVLGALAGGATFGVMHVLEL